MPLDHLWATWRESYLTGVEARRPDGVSLFESILEAPGSDLDKGIVARSHCCFVLMNRFPYTSGHVMVLPNRAVAALADLTAEEFEQLWVLVRDASVAIPRALGCAALNVGVNLGEAAGGSQSDHLHVHVVPRWVGDANFMTTVGEVRVISVSIDEAARRIHDCWPETAGE